jgi:hypothetical protein
MDENKILHADDLMLGDWVMVKERKGDFTKDYPIMVHSDTIIDVLAGNLIIEPIKLTDEILEKNGFNKTRDLGSGHTIKEGLELVFAGMFSMHYYEFVGTDNMDSACTGIYIDYVHELQHVLKQCEIKKNIVI